MNDEQQTRNGPTWAPMPSLAAPGPVPVSPVAYDAAPPPPFRSRWERSRGTVAGVAIGLLATGVFGGFALGTIPSPVSPGGQTSQVGTGFAPSHQQSTGGGEGGSGHGDGGSGAAFDS